MKNLQRAQITPKKMIESKGTQKHNERQNNTKKKKNEKSCVMQGNSYKNRKQDENAFVYGRTTSNSTNQKCANAKLPLKTYAIVVRNRQKSTNSKPPKTATNM